MALDAKKVYGALTTYVNESLIGVGALKGANCTIKSIVHQDGVNTITFEWTADDGTKRENVMQVYDGTPIYVWESGNHYYYGDLVIYASAWYRCVFENSDIEFDDTKWNEIGSTDGNYDIVQNQSLLPPRFTAADRKMYYSIEDGIFFLWDGTQWVAQKNVVQYSTLPTASATFVGRTVQFIGTTDDYTHGFFYECVENSGYYSWVNVATTDLSGKVDKETGKGLSTNDFTNTYKNQLDNLGTASTKDSINTVTENSTDIVESGAVYDAIEDVADVEENNDTTPYLYRKTPYASDRAYLRKLVGGSVAWNQLKSGLYKKTITTTPTIPEDDVYYSNFGTAVDNSITVGHRYFVKMSAQNGSENFLRMSVYVGSGSSILCENNNTIEKVVTAINTLNILRAYASNNQQTSASITLQVFDLTQMFGSEIADYIYTLEQSQAGSGIAYLQSYGFLTNDYYTTDSGSIQSVSVSGKKVVGFNQWDEEWELGNLSTANGAPVPSNSCIRTKNYIPIIPNAEYYFNNYRLRMPACYDENKVFISATSATAVGGIGWKLTMPQNAKYFKFDMSSDYGAVYKNDICLNLFNAAKNGTYEPYTSTAYNLQHDTLRGIIKKDANNRLYYDGDERYPDKKIQRYGIVDLGDSIWEKSSGNVFEGQIFADAKTGDYWQSAPNGLCEKYKVSAGVIVVAKTQDKVVSWGTTGDARIRIYDSDYIDSTASDFKTAVTGIKLVYELATPITTAEPAYQSLQIVDGDGTEQFIDYGVEQETRDVAIPVGHSSDYVNLPDWLKDDEYISDLRTLSENALQPNTPVSDVTNTDTWYGTNASLKHTIADLYNIIANLDARVKELEGEDKVDLSTMSDEDLDEMPEEEEAEEETAEESE